MFKNKIIAMLLIASAICLASLSFAANTPAWTNPKLSPDKRADLLVAAMTLDEKLTLVFGYFGTELHMPADEADGTPEVNYAPPAGARIGSAGYVPGISRLGIPPQWQTDAGIGVASQGASKIKRERTALPAGIGIAATWNADLAHEGGAMIGDEARRSGFNVMLAGGVNLLREPRNGRNFEYGGEDPLLAGTIVGSQVAGIQSNHLIATLKHFAVNDQETDRHFGNSIIDPAVARTSDLLAFQFALERSDAGSIMCAYNKVNGIYACENSWLLNDVLRRDWGFKGYVMSDWGADHSTHAAVESGLDQESGFPFDGKPYFGALLKEAVQKGEISEARVTTMTHRILRTMFAKGVFDHPVAESSIDFVAHAELSRKAAEQSIVLLKNNESILPLSATTKRIAIIGGNADKGVVAGGGSSLVHPIGGNAQPNLLPKSWPGPVMYHPSSPLAAIKKLAPNAAIRFADGTDHNGALRVARKSDVVIIFATQWAGESFDVSLTLSDNQDQLITAVATANPNTIVVLESGGPVLMPWIDQVRGVMAAWYPGTAGGDAIANVLFGTVNPSGHLPVTFPRSLEQLPHPAAPTSGDVRYTEGAAVGYKWFDAKKHEPLFAFGHGLSYTRFAYTDLSATPAKQSIVVNFKVRNIGDRLGFAVPQIYVSGDGWEAPKRLGAWKKISLAPDQTQSLSVTIDPRLLATFDSASNRWRIAAGTYQVMLGAAANQIGETVKVQLQATTLPVGWRPESD